MLPSASTLVISCSQFSTMHFDLRWSAGRPTEWDFLRLSNQIQKNEQFASTLTLSEGQGVNQVVSE